MKSFEQKHEKVLNSIHKNIFVNIVKMMQINE